MQSLKKIHKNSPTWNDVFWKIPESSSDTLSNLYFWYSEKHTIISKEVLKYAHEADRVSVESSELSQD